MKDIIKTKLKGFFSKFGQITYLTTVNYFDNQLASDASACTFGFIFSFIPIIILILTGCIGILKMSPALVETIINWTKQFNIFYDIESYVENLSSLRSFSGINIVLALFMIWMARKLFASIVAGMYSIFRTKSKPRPVLDQFFAFAGEVIIVVICGVVFLATFLSRQILTLPFFDIFRSSAPILFSQISNNIVHIAFYSILFLFTFVCYRVTTHTKPKLSLCFLNASICVTVFFFFVMIISKTINRTNYSSLYGVLSNLMILLFEVWFFFIIFMTCAQMLYVEQFFDSLLIGELYLLPEHDKKGLFNAMKRVLFITPSSLMKKENLVHFVSGEPIYQKDSAVTEVYFVVEGSVKEIRANGSEQLYLAGSSFGEPEFIMNIKRMSEAYAESNCTLLKIPAADFDDLIKKNPKAAAKAMGTISFYVENISKYI